MTARLFHNVKPIIGMVHLGPLPGSPRWSGPSSSSLPGGGAGGRSAGWRADSARAARPLDPLSRVFRAALHDAKILAAEGVDGILVENYGDAPFYPHEVPPETVAAMAALMQRLRAAVPGNMVWGVNVLRNDARAALCVAAATGAAFIRVNVHCGVTATDQGLLFGQAHETMRLRARLAPGVALFADAQVKHGRAIAPSSLTVEVADLCERGLADAVLITGSRTGEPPAAEELVEASRAAGRVPVLAASGVTADNVARLLPACQGVIVGTALKRGGRTEAALDPVRVRAFLRRSRA